MRSLYAAAVLALGTCLTGCASLRPTNKTVVDYNRIFANSRDEVLLTNILRASAHEPLQFSTMGTVTGGVRNNGSITIGLTNLIGGKDPFAVSPSATINDGLNPAVTIVPLADKDFAEGILSPVPLETMKYFQDQGWDPEMILMLAVGGILCDEGNGTQRLVLNRGQRSPVYRSFREMFGRARVPIQDAGDSENNIIRMPAKDALGLLKDGVGKDRKVKSIAVVLDQHGNATSDVDLTISKPAGLEIVGLDPSTICDTYGTKLEQPIKNLSAFTEIFRNMPSVQPAAKPANKRSNEAPPKGPQYYALLRSVESIIYFLGETERDWLQRHDCGKVGSDPEHWPDYERRRPTPDELGLPQEEIPAQRVTLLRIEVSCGPVEPQFRTFVKTQFNDRFYYVRRSSDLPADNRDYTLTTLSFLDALISLQTNRSAITSSAPVVTVGTQ